MMVKNPVMGQQVEKITLDNGLRILLEKVDFFDTVSIGFWINVGSKDELAEENGYAHFIEHMLFKGTEQRNSTQIAKEIDRVGGYLNAFTTREYTCFYVNMVAKHYKIGIDILADMLLNSLFEEIELEREKQVVLEEIRMYDDAPDQLVHDLFIENIWKNHSLGRPIMGTLENISEITRDKLLGFYQTNYHAENVVVSIAGNFDREKVLSLLSELPFPSQKQEKHKEDDLNMHFGVAHTQKKIEQVYSCWGFQGIPNYDPNRYRLFVFSTAFGGGTSSRLYQEIREKLGLCYAVYSFNSSFSNSGVFGIYSVTNPKNLKTLITAIKQQSELLIKEGISEEELDIAKEQIKGNIIFSKESLEARMNRNAKNEIIFGRDISYKEAIKNIDEVSTGDVVKIAKYLFESGNSSFYSVGPRGHQTSLKDIKL
jgi:predicted Zn-dependent peptidase